MTKWNYERDLELVACILEGLTQDGIEARLGYELSTQRTRLHRLDLSIRGGRQAKRDGLTPEQYLKTSHVYAAKSIPMPLCEIPPLEAIPVSEMFDTIKILLTEINDIVDSIKAKVG